MRHGGDLDAANERYGVPAEGWIDLSTGISPYPYPMPQLDAAIWQRLPSLARMQSLRETALRAYGAGERAHVALAPGAQALIDRLPHIGGGRARVAVVSPTYSEHVASWSRNAHNVCEITVLPDPADFDVVVLAKPNNPDGRMFARADLMALADDLGARERVLIVDECFADVLPHRSLAAEAGHRSLVILRSFGKFFGLAGLRLGFALGPRRIIRRIDDLMGPWPVSGPAIEIGIKALGDSSWIEAARLRLVEASRRLDTLAKESGLTTAGGTPLFRLLESDNAFELHQRLAGEGIWTRTFDYAPHWLRLGIPGSDEEFERLERALATIASDLIIARANAID
ncbi:MAG: threonine-phosphate decarboxylase [Rhizobiales bacterium]|nr:threonine-phosphate decarboxylase [Hyphomicrobiales bacterium]